MCGDRSFACQHCALSHPVPRQVFTGVASGTFPTLNALWVLDQLPQRCCKVVGVTGFETQSDFLVIKKLRVCDSRLHDRSARGKVFA
jgi:hypothetical protein